MDFRGFGNLRSTGSNWPRRGVSYYGRGFHQEIGRTQRQQIAETTKMTTYSNLHEVKVYHLNTDIKSEGKEVDEFVKTFKDPVADAVVKFSCHYDFTSRQFDMKITQVGARTIRFTSHDINCGKTEMQCDWSSSGMRMDLSDRHVFEQNFYLVLKYSLNNVIILESKFHFKVPYFQTETELVFKQLDQFEPSEEITRIFHQQSSDDRPSLGSPSLDSYVNLPLFEKLREAVHIEDLAGRNAIKHLALENVEIKGSHQEYYMHISPKTEKEIKFERWKEMMLCLVPMHKFDEIYNKPDDCYYVQIGNVHKGTIKIDTKKRLNTGYLQHIDFIPNRISFRACSNALDRMGTVKSFYLNFKEPSGAVGSAFEGMSLSRPSLLSLNMLQVTPESFQFEWYNEGIGTNTEQQLAIKNILNCKASPYPQVIFGPPGTGKTSTLVEAVAQILKLRPKSRVLITTQSNSASDEIGVRLLKFVSINQVYRFYSPSLLTPSSGGPNKTLKVSSNLRNKKLEWPLKEELKHFRVVISTLITSSRLANSDLAPGHFDYIFVDEISCATEPEALVPIVGLGMSSNKITANIVLLGDHLQLGPVLQSEELAAKLGLGVSMMERMMATEKYLKNPTYDDRFVVQLLDNYRSHPAILKFSSDQFYDGALRAKMPTCDQKLTETLSFLPNKKFPIIFHAVQIRSQLKGTSSYNEGEIQVVEFYIRKLLATKLGDAHLQQSDIGVISPYLAQLARLKEVIGVEWPQIEMGTTEYFQGREKRVIIISTVKSQGGIGFLSNQKRCNVMLTRAMSLEIVIGNPQTLSKDPFWKAFVEYCQLNGAFVDELSFQLSNMFC